MACSCSNGKTSPASGAGGTRAGFSASPPPAWVSTTAPAKPAPLCAPAPKCPACGELECLCRPRWVAGMVVKEDDLNRLDYYITAKQRLHNRQLFGSGVACGLVVTCHPCGGGVVSVSPGYALGPCGEDIVVCAPDAVDVCALIQKCRALEQQTVECRPWGDTTGCKDVQESWVLAIRYMEEPSRNAPMLRAGSGGDCGCGGTCGCGGGGRCPCGATASPAASTRTATPIACAPTVVCETYRYEVFRAPAQPDCGSDRTQLPPGRLAQQVMACGGDLIKLVQNPPQAPLGPNLSRSDMQQWNTYCGQLRAALYAHFTRFGTTHCDQLAKLCQFSCPQPSGDATAFSNAMRQLFQALEPILLAALQDCICLALLPPCADPQTDPRVPLAVITVSGAHDCAIVGICNWTPLRRIVGTTPNFSYWLSAFNLIDTLRRELFCLCCEPLSLGRRGLFAPGAAPGEHAEGVASPFGFDFASLGLLGKWLGTGQADARELLVALNVTPDPAETAALTARVAALETEIAALRRTQPGPG